MHINSVQIQASGSFRLKTQDLCEHQTCLFVFCDGDPKPLPSLSLNASHWCTEGAPVNASYELDKHLRLTWTSITSHQSAIRWQLTDLVLW